MLGMGLERVTSDPSTNLFTGRLVYNTATGLVRVYNGSAWAAVNSLNPNVYFNKFVGAGAGYYTTLVSAMATAAAGDHFLVTDNTTEVADVTIPSDVRVTYMPGVVTTFTGADNYVLSGANAELMNARATWSGAAPQTRLVFITADSCRVEGHFRWNRAATLSSAVGLTAGGNYAWVAMRVVMSAGSITDPYADSSTGSFVNVWGL
jgi:hypothetical protein